VSGACLTSVFQFLYWISFFFSISSINIWFLYQIWSSFFCLLFLVCLILFLIEIWTYDFILFLCVKFGFYSFQIYNFFFFLVYFFLFFFKFISNYFGWLRILHCCFFGFAFYAMIQPHDLCHKFWKLNRVDFVIV
jgi:hypothetical protein